MSRGRGDITPLSRPFENLGPNNLKRNLGNDILDNNTKSKNLREMESRKISESTQDRDTLLVEMQEALNQCLANTQKLSKNCFNSTMIDGLSNFAYCLEEETNEYGSSKFDYNKMSTLIEGASRLYGYRVENLYDLSRQTLVNIALGQKENRTNGINNNENSPLRKKTGKDINLKEDSTLLPDNKFLMSSFTEDNKTLDPHFLKVSSLVDEAGVSGLLLNNLQVDDQLNLIFDGSSLACPRGHINEINSIDDKPHNPINTHTLNELINMKDIGDISDLHICPEIRNFDYVDAEFELNTPEKSQSKPTFSGADSPKSLPFVLINETEDNDSHTEYFDPIPADIYSLHPPLDEFESLPESIIASKKVEKPVHLIPLLTNLDDLDYYNSNQKLISPQSTTKQTSLIRKPKRKEIQFSIDQVNLSKLDKPCEGFEQNRYFLPKRRKTLRYNYLISDDQGTYIFPFPKDLIYKLNTAHIMLQFLKVDPVDDEQTFKNTVFDFERKNEHFEISWINIDDYDANAKISKYFVEQKNVDFVSESQSCFDDPQIDILNNVEEFDLPFNLPQNSTPTSTHQNHTETKETNYEAIPNNLLNKFAKSSRYVNVSKLKSTISEIVLNNNQSSNQSLVVASNTTPFHNIVERALESIDGVDKENCSVHLLFVCLLYVCNEKELLLRQDDDKNIMILNDAPFNEHIKDDKVN